MTWTVNNNLRNFLAGGGSLEDAFNGGDMVISSSVPTALVTCEVAGSSADTNVVTVTFATGIINNGVSNATAVSAVIRNSNEDVLLSTDNVGTTGADVPFNDNTGWNEGGTVAPGAATIPLSLIVDDN